MDAAGCAGHAQAASPVVQWCPEATALLGIPGLAVTHVAEDGDGATAVYAETHPDLREQARECHGCGRRSVIRERPETAPRDVPWGSRVIRLHWRKMRLECTNPECPVITFTEWLPAVPPRKRLTSREREEIGAGIGDDLLCPSRPRPAGTAWPSAPPRPRSMTTPTRSSLTWKNSPGR